MTLGSIITISALIGIAPEVLVLAIVWSLIWKGVALWKSARKNSVPWFIVLLIVNTLGILEILYIFIFSELGKKPTRQSRKRKK